MDRTMSIPPKFYEQAQKIIEQRGESAFKNWQEVIRLAIHYGLPEVGRVQKREQQAQKHQQEKEKEVEIRDYIRESNANRNRLHKVMRKIPAPKARICRITKQTTSCTQTKGEHSFSACEECKKAGKQLYN